MKLYRSLKILSGILMIISSITVFVMVFLEPETMGVFFRFNIDIQAENLGELIAGFAVGIGAVVGMIIATIFFGIIYFLFYLIIGLVTIFVKKGKGLIITVVILTCLSLFFEIRALVILIMGEYTSLIIPIRLAVDAIILAISIYSLIALPKYSKMAESAAIQ